jgi:hypothetical protein
VSKALRSLVTFALFFGAFNGFQIIATSPASAALTCAQGGICLLGNTGPGGGKVFNISGKNYLEAASSDLAQLPWASAVSGAISYTANSLTGWRLPTLDESKLMGQQRSYLGFSDNAYYWTSTDYDATQAYTNNMTFTSWYPLAKSTSLFSRPIRAFSAISCANGGACLLGETGPGGGKVFYVPGGTFTSTGSDCGASCKYLEAVTTCDVGTWTSKSGTVGVSARGTALGTGFSNTKAVVNYGATSGANHRAWVYENNSFTDWFLPSQDELTILWNARSTLAYCAAGNSLSSTENDETTVMGGAYDSGITINITKNAGSAFRIIRAFGDPLLPRTNAITTSLNSSYNLLATPPVITSTASLGAGTKSYTSSTSSICTINSTTGVVTFLAAGSCALTATITADGTYVAATSPQSLFTITKGIPTLSISLSGGSTSLTYGTASVITLTSTVAGKISLRANGKSLSGCINVVISTSRTCTFKSSSRGQVFLTVNFTPTNSSSYLAITTPATSIPVVNRTTRR